MQNDFDEDNNELQFSDEQVQQLVGFDQREKQRLKKTIIKILIVLLILAVGCWWIIGECLHYTTHSRRISLNYNAKMVYQVVLSWDDAQNPSLSTQTAQFCGEDDFSKYLEKFVYRDESKYWYAIVYDSDGDLLYTLFSYKQIPEKYLTSPPTAEETTKLLNSYFDFRRKKAVGVWYADNEKND